MNETAESCCCRLTNLRVEKFQFKQHITIYTPNPKHFLRILFREQISFSVLLLIIKSCGRSELTLNAPELHQDSLTSSCSSARRLSTSSLTSETNFALLAIAKRLAKIITCRYSKMLRLGCHKLLLAICKRKRNTVRNIPTLKDTV